MPASIKHLSDKKVCYNSLLARWTDGLYYAAALTKVDKTKKTCRVAFEDGSEIWVSNRDVHIQLTIDQLSDDEDIVCCICDDGNSEPPNEIILCDVCQQGYHQKCHLPPVDSSKLDASEDTKDHKDWFCATCSYILNQTNRAKLGATAAAAATTGSASAAQKQQQPQKQQAKSTPQQSPTKAGPVTPQPSKSRPPPPVTVPVVAPKIAATSEPSPRTHIIPPPSRQPPKVKQTPPAPQLHRPTTTVGAIKPPPQGTHQRSAPYYPLSNQVRAAVASSSSTAALASMTASSALVVGSTAGRTKQDLVKQGNRASQRQSNDGPLSEATSVLSPPKHAVRKSGVNFAVAPVKQSALPTATRSVPSPGTTAPPASNGPSHKADTASPAATPARPPATIISTSTGTLSVLTSPVKHQQQQQHQKATESARPAAPVAPPAAAVAVAASKDTSDHKQTTKVNSVDGRASQQQQSNAATTTTTTVATSAAAAKGVTSSDRVYGTAATQSKSIINSDSSGVEQSSPGKTAKKPLESESVVHSTSDNQRHITDSPQLEISFDQSPEQSMSSPARDDQQDNNNANATTNGNAGGGPEHDRGPASKSTTVIVGGSAQTG